MRWVQHAAIRPHRCAVIPFVGNSNSQEGFIDTGQDLAGWDPHVYVSVTAVKQMATLIGWQPRHVEHQANQKVQALEAELEAVRGELAVAERKLEAVQVLKQAGYTASRKPGRPPKQKVA